MPQLDITTYTSQVAWLVISFVVLLIVMWKAIVPRISGALEARQKRMDDNLERAAALRKEAEGLLEAYEKAQAQARSQAQATIAEAGAKASEEASRRHAELAGKLTKRIADSEAAIATAKEAALASLRTAAIEVAIAATERLVGEKPDAGATAAAVDAAAKSRA